LSPCVNTQALYPLELVPGSFSGLQLTALQLRGVRFPTRPGCFANLSSLDSLHFQAGDNSSVSADMFQGLSHLTDLRINGAAGGTWVPGMFRGLPNLVSLYAGWQHPSLKWLPADVFDGLTSLQRLALGANGLSALNAGVFRGLRSLKYLDLFDNCWRNSSSTFPPGVWDELSPQLEIMGFAGYYELDPGHLTSRCGVSAAGDISSSYARTAQVLAVLPAALTQKRANGSFSIPSRWSCFDSEWYKPTWSVNCSAAVFNCACVCECEF
jgi:hypothetical protein